MRVSSIANRQRDRHCHSVCVLDSIGNQLILTVYAGPDRYPRELHHYAIDSNGMVSRRIIVVATRVGEITVSNPALDCHVVTLATDMSGE